MSYENYFEKPRSLNTEKKEEKKDELTPKERLVSGIFGRRIDKSDLPELDDQVLTDMLDKLPVIEKQTKTKLSQDAIKQAVTLKFGLEDNEPHTYQEVGLMLGVSGNRARQLTEKALRIFRREYHVDRNTQRIVSRAAKKSQGVEGEK